MLTHHHFAPLFYIETTLKNQRYSNGISTNITIETTLKDQQAILYSSNPVISLSRFYRKFKLVDNLLFPTLDEQPNTATIDIV